MTVSELKRRLAEYDDGVLKFGSHNPGREFCALEFESKVRGRPWSDEPMTLPDIRPLNDALWSSDAERTKALLPVMAALWDWDDWPRARRDAFVKAVLIDTVRKILSRLPKLPLRCRQQCRAVTTLREARSAANRAHAVLEQKNLGMFGMPPPPIGRWCVPNPTKALRWAALAADAAFELKGMSARACGLWVRSASQSQKERP